MSLPEELWVYLRNSEQPGEGFNQSVTFQGIHPLLSSLGTRGARLITRGERRARQLTRAEG